MDIIVRRFDMKAVDRRGTGKTAAAMRLRKGICKMLCLNILIMICGIFVFCVSIEAKSKVKVAGVEIYDNAEVNQLFKKASQEQKDVIKKHFFVDENSNGISNWQIEEKRVVVALISKNDPADIKNRLLNALYGAQIIDLSNPSGDGLKNCLTIIEHAKSKGASDKQIEDIEIEATLDYLKENNKHAKELVKQG